MKKILAYACVFFILAQLLPGVMVTSFFGAIWAAILYAVIMGTLGLLVKVLAIPFNWLTFGLVNFLINGWMVYIVSGLTASLSIDNYGTALFMGLILTLVQGLVEEKERYRY